MFTGSAMPVERPAGWRSNNLHQGSVSGYNSPNGSRRSSVSSVASAQTDPGLYSSRSRHSSVVSETSTSSKSGLRSLFARRDKKPKEKRDVDKIILTSKHAAAVKTKMMMDARYRDKKGVKTAGVVGTIKSGHLTAADQEARHPHSGPPALHPKSDMPSLTRIISGDERDEEDESERMERARFEWELSKASTFARIREHDSDESATPSADPSGDEDEPPREVVLSPGTERGLYRGPSRRPSAIARNSYGGRFHKDQHGNWTREQPS